jgi:hypothetical protein
MKLQSLTRDLESLTTPTGEFNADSGLHQRCLKALQSVSRFLAAAHP